MTEWKDLIAQAQPRHKTVRLCLRGDLLEALDDAVRAARVGLPAGAATPDTDELVAARAAVAGATTEFRLRGLGRDAYRALEAAHPDPESGGGWNADTFPEALIRACLVDPVVGADDPLMDLLTSGQVDLLFEAAFLACNEVDDVPLPVRG